MKKSSKRVGKIISYTLILVAVLVVAVSLIVGFVGGPEDSQTFACGIVCVLMVLDYISGTMKAIYEKNFHSSKMREGLFHKFAMCGILAICWVVYRGYQFLQLPDAFALFLPSFHTAFAIMEIASILENLGRVYPALQKLAVWKTFKTTIEEDSKKGE